MPPGFPSYTPLAGRPRSSSSITISASHHISSVPTHNCTSQKSQLSLKEFPFIYGASARLEQAQCESKPDQFFSNPEIQLRGLPLESVRPWYSGRVTRVMIVVYWLYAGFCQVLPPLDKYRLHTREEEEERNLVPLRSVVKAVRGVFLVSSQT